MPRFVVLEHAVGGASHFDLMLEHAGTLLTFSFAEFPAPSARCARIFDHRLTYLDFEGDIGRGKGAVKRVESGECELLAQTPDRLRVKLHGLRLKGIFRLTKSQVGNWEMTAE